MGKTEIKKVIELNFFLEDFIRAGQRPFADENFLIGLLVKISRKFSCSLEKLFGHKIYIQKKGALYDFIPAKFYKVINRMAEMNMAERISCPRPAPDWPSFPAIRIKLNCRKIASGHALDYDQACAKGFAEAIERYAYTDCKKEKLIFGSFKSLKPQGAIEPESFILFSKKQLNNPEHPSCNFDADYKWTWIRAASFTDGQENLILAQFAYFFENRFIGEPRMREPNSNGGAAGSSWEMAAHNALCEAIERDSFMVHWLNKISPPRISLASIKNLNNKTINKILEEYKKYAVNFTVCDITTDIGIPAFLTVIVNRAPGYKSVHVSSHADLDGESALVSSLLEGIRVGYYPKASAPELRKINKKAPQIANLEERRIYWSEIEKLKYADFLFNGRIKNFPKNYFKDAEVKNKLGKMKELFKLKKIRAYLADITPAIGKEFGLVVLASFSPDLYPLYLQESSRYLGIRRLYEAPVNMGIFKKPKTEEEINPIPHPFL